MAEDRLTAEDVRQKTSELLGDEGADYSYITDELVEGDAQSDSVEVIPDDSALTTYYGNNARYGAQGGVQGYYFNYAPGDACGSTHTYFLSIAWHHVYIRRCPNGREMWSFTR